jgi:hypothetical protein
MTWRDSQADNGDTTMTNYYFTDHAQDDAMRRRNLTHDDVIKVMEQGATWNHYNVSMRTRLGDHTVCWRQVGDTKHIITIWDNTDNVQSKEVLKH